jgi:hypothetical protein
MMVRSPITGWRDRAGLWRGLPTQINQLRRILHQMTLASGTVPDWERAKSSDWDGRLQEACLHAMHAQLRLQERIISTP